MTRQRVIGFIVMGVSLAALAASSWRMQQRLSGREDLDDRPIVWFHEPFREMELSVSGDPLEFTVVDAPADATAERALRVNWREDSYDLPIIGHDDPRLPGLMRFDDWLRVLPMVEGAGRSERALLDALESGAARPRVVIAARYPAPGFDPDSWGLVRRNDWRYVFLELHEKTPPDDAIEVTHRTYAELEAIFAPGPYSDRVELTQAEKDEMHWQHAAMLQVTPATLYRAKDKQVRSGMLSMGWTWPVACASVLGLMVGGGLVVTARMGH